MVGKVAIVGVWATKTVRTRSLAICSRRSTTSATPSRRRVRRTGNGEARQSKDYNDLDEVPEAVPSATVAAARNAAHLTGVSNGGQYRPMSDRLLLPRGFG
jgi:hypothetical protein